VSDKKTIGL